MTKVTFRQNVAINKSKFICYFTDAAISERSSSRNRDRRGDKRGRSNERRATPVDRRRRRSGSYHSRQSRSFSRLVTTLFVLNSFEF